MSEDRPSTTRRVTRKSEEARKAPLEDGVRFTFRGETIEVRFGDINNVVTGQLRKNTGFGFRSLLEQLQKDADVDLLAAFIWVARRCNGEAVAFEDIEVTYDDLDEGKFTIEFITAADRDADPEAEGGNS